MAASMRRRTATLKILSLCWDGCYYFKQYISIKAKEKNWTAIQLSVCKNVYVYISIKILKKKHGSLSIMRIMS